VSGPEPTVATKYKLSCWSKETSQKPPQTNSGNAELITEWRFRGIGTA
jgi:hypothetical protein